MPSAANVRPQAGGQRFLFGGVEIELLGAAGFSYELPPDHARFLGRDGASPSVPRVTCSVRRDPALLRDDRDDREIVLQEHDLQTTGVRAHLQPLSHNSWAVSARVAPGAHNLGRLLDALSAAIVERSGGLLVHAAGVELDGHAYLFVGPSGAGKTTAAGQVFGARSFCVDRAVVMPSAQGWRVHALPGGTDPIDRAPDSRNVTLPLGGILRVKQASTVDAHPLAPHEAVMTVRESVFSADRDEVSERKRLDTIATLATEVPLMRLDSVLGAPLAQTLRRLERA